jgi:predicted DNA-binding transcriptional regulator AlpA
MQTIRIDPLLPKAVFAEARGISVRSLDRQVSQRRMPRGEPLDGTRVGWRASLVALSLEELRQLAEAQGQAGHRPRSVRMREVGARGGRRVRQERAGR